MAKLEEQTARWAEYHAQGKRYRNPDPAGRAEEFVELLLRMLEVLRATGRPPRTRR